MGLVLSLPYTEKIKGTKNHISNPGLKSITPGKYYFHFTDTETETVLTKITRSGIKYEGADSFSVISHWQLGKMN